MRKLRETVGEAWMRELSLVRVDGSDRVGFEEACRVILAINPMLGLDGMALHFTAQGWLAAKNQVAVTE